MKFEEFQKFAKFAKKQGIQKLKVGTVEFEFSQDAIVPVRRKDKTPEIKSVADDTLFYSVQDPLFTEAN